MEGIALLKITKEMWLEIKNGNKDVDIRKLNKDYIQVGFTIVFIDVETCEHFGNKICIGKLYQKPSHIRYDIKHQPTIDYVNKNYIEEPYVIMFTLGV